MNQKEYVNKNIGKPHLESYLLKILKVFFFNFVMFVVFDSS